LELSRLYYSRFGEVVTLIFLSQVARGSEQSRRERFGISPYQISIIISMSCTSKCTAKSCDTYKVGARGNRSITIFDLQQIYPIGHRFKQIRLKEVDKAHMKRLIILTLIKMCGEAILLALTVGIVIAVIGNINNWDTSIAYSNAFFIAGCLLVVTGGMSRLSAGQEWTSFHLLSAESFRGMSNSERANFIIDASSSFRLVILGLLSGILLIIISAILTRT